MVGFKAVQSKVVGQCERDEYSSAVRLDMRQPTV